LRDQRGRAWEHLLALLLGMLFQGWRPGAFAPSALRSAAGRRLPEPAERRGRQAARSIGRDALVLAAGPSPFPSGPAANPGDE